MSFNNRKPGEDSNRLSDNYSANESNDPISNNKDTLMTGANSTTSGEIEKPLSTADTSKSIQNENHMENNHQPDSRDDFQMPEAGMTTSRESNSAALLNEKISGETTYTKSTCSDKVEVPRAAVKNPDITNRVSEPNNTGLENDMPSNEHAPKEETATTSAGRDSSFEHGRRADSVDACSFSQPMGPPRVPVTPTQPNMSKQIDGELTQNNVNNQAHTPKELSSPTPGVPLEREFFEHLQNEGRARKPRQTQAEKERQLAETVNAIKSNRDKSRRDSTNPPGSPTAESSVPSLSTRGSTLPNFVTTVDEEDAHFAKLREKFEKRKSQGLTSLEEEIEFFKLQSEEKKRKQRIQREIEEEALEDSQDFQRATDETLFLSDAEETNYNLEELDEQNQKRLRASGALDKGYSTWKSSKSKSQAFPKISKRMMNESVNVGIQGFEEQKAAKKSARSKKNQDSNRTKQKASVGKGTNKRKRSNKDADNEPNGLPKKRGRKNKVSAAGVIDGLSEVVGTTARRSGAQANSDSADDNPQILSSKKQEALKAMIAEIPTENQRIGKMDIDALDEASKKLTWPRRIKADPDSNGWRMKGMKSALKNFQLIGLGRMREFEKRPVNPKGGIIADEMGLGKTVSMIANMVDGKPNPEQEDPKPTLIVVPSALTQQWLDEIDKHTDETTFEQVMIYNSGLKTRKPEAALQRSDVVITTYHELRKSWPTRPPPPHLSKDARRAWLEKQYKTKRGPLHRVMWLRVVLDECQQVKNTIAQAANAACGLFARHRWLMSGTILTNDIMEFYSYFKFLKVPVLGERELFMQNFINDKKAQDRLRELLKSIMIRRTHDDKFLEKPLVKLPSTVEQTIDLEFTAFERAFYSVIYRACCAKARRYWKTKGIKVHTVFIHILQLLLLLRQMTGHLFNCVDTLGKCLEPEDISLLHTSCDMDDPKRTDDAMNKVRAILEELEPEIIEESRNRADNLAKDLSKHYKENGFLRVYRKMKEPEKAGEAGYACSICQGPLEEIWKGSCEHIFCEDCLENLAEGTDKDNQEDSACPIPSCTASLEDVRKISRRTLQKILANKAWDPAKFFHSTKTERVEQLVRGWLEQDPQTKIIIFTQFLEMVEILGIVCQLQGWSYCKYTGNMTIDARNSTIETFKTNSEKRILIMSLKAGGVGLNLTEATKVILVDLFWNEATEQQAKARVHRIGQTRPTELLRLTVKNSVDERIMCLQDKKTEEITRILSGDVKCGGSTITELLKLFEVDTEAENGLPNGFMLPDDGVNELLDGAQDEMVD